MKMKPMWTDLKKLHPLMKFDIVYASPNNFFGSQVYASPDAFLLSHVAEDLLQAHLEFLSLGYGILIYDAYRPWSVTQLFWNQSSEDVRPYLANPKTGSSHNRGCAVDCTLYKIEDQQAVTMPSAFDEMNEKSHLNYLGGSEAERQVRDLFQSVMKRNQFQGIQNEWWHFNHTSHSQHLVMNFTFEEIRQVLQTQRRPDSK
jgi:D-alanyl-D-alanine dipeptidase